MTMPITVIIPTRERGDVLASALASVCAQEYDSLDILVSDNYSSDCTESVVRSMNDPRVRYVNTGRRLSMAHNWEFALTHVPVDHRYVMVIGDDDGLVPGALDRLAALVRETGTKAVNSTYVTFIWPNAENFQMGRLLVPMRRGFEMRGTKEWLRRVIRGRASYGGLPILYVGGAIHMSLIDTVRRRTGSFFQSCQPDIFSSVVLSCVTDRYAFSHEPFAIAGHSRHSNGASWNASSISSAPKEMLQANKMFASEQNIPWHEDIPTLPGGNIPFSLDLLVYESYLQSANLHGDIFRLSKTDMLALFLARDIRDRDGMALWSTKFAQKHLLNLSDARRKAATLRLRMKWDKLAAHSAAFFDTYRLEPRFGVRMRDVYEAGIVAATILSTKPGRLKSYANTIAKKLGRYQGIADAEKSSRA